MQCPICTGAAKDIAPPDFDGKVIQCPNDGTYEIAGSALRRFESVSVYDRARALAKAKSFQGLAQRPTITTTCL